MEKFSLEGNNLEKAEKVDVLFQKISREIANLREIREGGHPAYPLHKGEVFNELCDILEEIKRNLSKDYGLEENERYNTPDFSKIIKVGYEDYFQDLEEKMTELEVNVALAGLSEEMNSQLKRAEKICAELKVKFEL
jgi:hypothetical protein